MCNLSSRVVCNACFQGHVFDYPSSTLLTSPNAHRTCPRPPPTPRACPPAATARTARRRPRLPRREARATTRLASGGTSSRRRCKRPVQGPVAVRWVHSTFATRFLLCNLCCPTVSYLVHSCVDCAKPVVMSAIVITTLTWIPCAHAYRLREAVQRFGIGKWNHILDDPEYSIVVRDSLLCFLLPLRSCVLANCGLEAAIAEHLGL
jgi:hypothetical protein